MRPAAEAPAEGSPPASWVAYFSAHEYEPSDRRVGLIEALLKYLHEPAAGAQGRWLLQAVQLRYGRPYFVPLDFVQLEERCGGAVPDLFAALKHQPEEGLGCIGAALHESLFGMQLARETLCLPYQPKPKRIAVRLYNCQHVSLSLRQLKAQSIGKLVTLTGTVVRAGLVRQEVTALPFSCGKCGATICTELVGGVYVYPTRCSTTSCRSRTFSPCRKTASTRDRQSVRLQEQDEGIAPEEGRIPRTIECELADDLVGVYLPGDSVVACGVVKYNNDGEEPRGRSKGQGLFTLYIDAVSLHSTRREQGSTSKRRRDDHRAQNLSQEAGCSGSGQEHSSETHKAFMNLKTPEFSSSDLEFISLFCKDYCGAQFRHLVHSLCPAIFGHQMVKAGLLLSLFGGVRKFADAESKLPVRGDVHILLVGDPGLGKSQLLKATAAVAPRGLYVCGNTTTNAGLTVAVVRDTSSGEYCFEAGAMVMADCGVCCVDEFDKMKDQHLALLEAMEQQQVSVAKAGLVANLAARTSVVAAANPVGGHYMRSKTVNENLKMSAAIQSRFDLIFLLLDRPNEAMDQKLSEHVMAIHSGSAKRTKHTEHLSLAPVRTHTLNELDGGRQYTPLHEQLKFREREAENFEPLPAPLIRKYIAYAHQYCHPILSKEAKEELKQFYLRLRKEASSSEGTAITARQLDSLIRLAQARARVELRELVTHGDALDVIEIMKASLRDKLQDENAMLDFRRGGGMSKQAQTKRFLADLHKRATEGDKSMFTIAELYSIADEIKLRVKDMESFIENMNTAGYLLKKGPRVFALSSSWKW